MPAADSDETSLLRGLLTGRPGWSAAALDRLLAPAARPLATAEGRPVLQLGGQSLALDHPPAALAAAAAPPPPGRVVVAGVGDGAVVDAALAASPAGVVVAWDREPAPLRALLATPARQAAVRAGRLVPVLDTGVLALPPLGPGDRLLRHPVLGPSYAHAEALLTGRPGPRVLVGEGQLMAGDLAQALAEEGLAPWPLALDGLAPDALADAAAALGAGALWVINHVHGLAEACAGLGLQLVTWEIDPALDRPRRPTRPVPDAHIFTWRAAHVPQFQAVGYPHVHHLPLAAPARRRPLVLDAETRARFGAPVSFVGESMADRAAGCAQAAVEAVARWLSRRGQPPTAAPARVQQLLDAQRRDLDRWILPALVRQHLPGLESGAAGSRLSMLLGEVVAAERRLSRVAALAPFGIHAWGDPGWQRIADRGVRVRGRAGHFDTLTRIYNATRINVDIGRLYQRDIVTMRVFDVLACGAFVLADHSEALTALLRPGVEVETWRTVGELVDKCRHYLAHPDQAAAIARRGQAAVRERHSIRARVAEMRRAISPRPPAP